MKKFALTALLVMTICGTAVGAQIFTTTIQNTTVQKVREISLVYMVGENFAIDRVDDYTMTFTKGFGDVFWGTQRNMTVRFNVLQTERNVKLIVTQFENSPQMLIYGQREIEHLIPLIREIRHSIDGTPLDQIVNEATNQRPSAPPVKSSGLSFDGLKITIVEPGGIAAQAGLKPGDKILGINGRPADENMLQDIDVRLAARRTVMIEYERDGERDLATLR